VTDGGDDHGVDGMVLVPTTSAQLSLSTETVPQTFYVGQSSPAGSATAALPAMASISTSGHELALGLIERILGDQEALNLHYQLQDSDAIRAHLDASNTQELDRGVSMLTHPLTQDNWMPEDCLDYLIQERRRNAKSPWTELWDSEVAVDTQNQTD
jgi:hypothetical protein